MRLSHLFTKTTKENPADEVSKNAQLLTRAGFINKEMAGAYSFLPLGLKVIQNIKQIVREEMDAIGGQEMIMTIIQRKDLWEKTDRWDESKVDVWFKTELQAGGEIGLAWSHEEPMCDMMRNFVTSYRDLPTYLYQFQPKLRNELRAKSGVMRGREFLMKDMYSFSLDEEGHEKFYSEATEAYKKVFNRIGIGEDTYVTFASGGAFTKFSHEFQTLVETGEDVIYINREKGIAINEEVLNKDTLDSLGVTESDLEKVNTSEVGNIFNFGTSKSEQLDLFYTNEKGERIPVWLGSYGIGITRLMGVIAEKFSDDKGLVWPASIAPYVAHMVVLGKDDDVKKQADEVYKQLTDAGVAVLYDDRDASNGEKFGDADLLGMPYRLVISQKTGDQIEVKERTSDDIKLVDMDEVIILLNG